MAKLVRIRVGIAGTDDGKCSVIVNIDGDIRTVGDPYDNEEDAVAMSRLVAARVRETNGLPPGEFKLGPKIPLT